MLDTMIRADPLLFYTTKKNTMKTKNFRGYSSACQTAWDADTQEEMVRRPVILTEEQYKNIEENHRNTYEEAISYSSGLDANGKDKKFWYICPRYYGIKEKRSLSEEEVKSGKFGLVIPKKIKKADGFPKNMGYNILEFHKNNKYPGFLSPEKHPDGKCMPCCFKDWNSKARVDSRKRCTQEKPKKKIVKKNYIEKGHPLNEGVKGYLDPRIITLLGIDNQGCETNKTTACFLRRGVSGGNQSFVASIAMLKSETQKYSMKQMKEYLIRKMTLKHFVTIYHGNLIDIFYDKGIEDGLEDNFAINKEILWEAIREWTESEQQHYVSKITKSFLNFKTFIRDENTTIDHTYLWDFICMPGIIDDHGINLVILEIDDETGLSNVNILCPTNHYANSYDRSKKTALLFRKDGFFEPIFHKDKKEESYLFDPTLSVLSPTLDKIQQAIIHNCKTTKGLPKVYKFEKNISYITLVKILKSISDENNLPIYEKVKNVLNYNGKIIGVIVRTKESEEFFLPCRPSPLMYFNDDLELETNESIFLHDVIRVSYDKTMSFLRNISNESKGKIKSKPQVQLIEDGNIIGILTETDQYVPVEPISRVEKEDEQLETNENTDYIHVEKVSSKIYEDTTKKNNSMENYEAIITEANVYNLFRTTLRVLLEHEENLQQKVEIKQIIDSKDDYYNKLEKIIKIIISVMGERVVFVDKYDASNWQKRVPCIKTATSSTKDCRIEVPRKNLFNEQSNEETYFGRIADELIRYHVLRTFVLANDDEESILLLPEILADLNDDEIIVSHDNELVDDQDYIKSLRRKPSNKYQKFNSFDSQTHNATIRETPRDIDKLSNAMTTIKWNDLERNERE